MRLETAPTGVIALMVGAVSNCAYTVRLETAATGSGENIALPNYFLKPHLDCDPRTQTNSLRYIYRISNIKMSTRPSNLGYF